MVSAWGISFGDSWGSSWDASAPPVVPWEYICQLVDVFPEGPSVNALNQCGMDGWDLVSVVVVDGDAGRQISQNVYKRLKQ